MTSIFEALGTAEDPLKKVECRLAGRQVHLLALLVCCRHTPENGPKSGHDSALSTK